MPSIDPDWVSVTSAIFTGVATVITYLAYRFHRSLEKNRQYLLKGDALLKNFQSLIITFANVHATAKEDCSNERSEKIRSLSKEIKYTSIIIASLNPDVGAQIESWRLSKDSKGDSLPRTVDYMLGNLGGSIGDNDYDFLYKKLSELRAIQDDIFKTMSA